ncbi:MAG TPA: site-specific integrase [Candidatus Pullichristensenella avicola]|nr:site-specific integrase [Candidatus Pullichristensenella avicola]
MELVMRMTLEGWITHWVAMRSAGLRPRTIEGYLCLLRRHIAPSIGGIALSDLTPDDVMAMLSPLCAAGKTRTAELCFVLLRAALRDALRLRQIPMNPMDAILRPKHRQKRPEPWAPEDIQRYLFGIRTDKYRIAWLLAILCGLRRGEICGLRWSDIDLRARVLHIRRQRVAMESSRVIEGPPKSASGIRDVPLPDGLVSVLREAFRLGDGYVVPITPKGLGNAHRTVIRRLGLPYLPLHGLRHTMATNALRNGASMKGLQGVLGHADFGTTANIYTHVDPTLLRGAVDAAGVGVVY